MRGFLTSRLLDRFRHDLGGLAALGGLVAIVLLALFGPMASPYGETDQLLERTYEHPTREHLFGLDELGRDVLTRVFYGGRISLAVGFAGAAISLLLGVSIGGAAGLLGGFSERAIMRMIDILYGIPLLLIVIALMVLFGQSLVNIFIALGLVYWLGMARVVRARVVELRGQEFIDAARAIGLGRTQLFLRHILPNTTGVVVVTATFMIPQAIFAESFLSFLGLGVTLPHASWGTLASDGLKAMRSHPHVLLFPSLAICATMLAFQTVGEALRRAIDPREAELD